MLWVEQGSGMSVTSRRGHACGASGKERVRLAGGLPVYNLRERSRCAMSSHLHGTAKKQGNALERAQRCVEVSLVLCVGDRDAVRQRRCVCLAGREAGETVCVGELLRRNVWRMVWAVALVCVADGVGGFSVACVVS